MQRLAAQVRAGRSPRKLLSQRLGIVLRWLADSLPPLGDVEVRFERQDKSLKTFAFQRLDRDRDAESLTVNCPRDWV
ncbi:hypothetical protein AB4Z34_15830 [Ensifer sp. 2YAB10]|uniref:hypothetical protein n=1 Tax=Ensifer sp. 2YAB10 TaxID=3233021 RepID=UPI003F9150D9